MFTSLFYSSRVPEAFFYYREHFKFRCIYSHMRMKCQHHCRRPPKRQSRCCLNHAATVQRISWAGHPKRLSRRGPATSPGSQLRARVQEAGLLGTWREARPTAGACPQEMGLCAMIDLETKGQTFLWAQLILPCTDVHVSMSLSSGNCYRHCAQGGYRVQHIAESLVPI